MSVGILLITHNRIGEEFLQTAAMMLGSCPLPSRALAVFKDDDPDWLRVQAQRLIEELDQGDGVLVFTDMYGSTPSNVANSLQREERVMVVAGVNLPMIVRACNYPALPLKEMVERVLSGGMRGILNTLQDDTREV